MTWIFYMPLWWPGGGIDTKMRISTESWPWRRKFSCCSCWDSNPQPFHDKSCALPLSCPCSLILHVEFVLWRVPAAKLIAASHSNIVSVVETWLKSVWKTYMYVGFTNLVTRTCVAVYWCLYIVALLPKKILFVLIFTITTNTRWKWAHFNLALC